MPSRGDYTAYNANQKLNTLYPKAEDTINQLKAKANQITAKVDEVTPRVDKAVGNWESAAADAASPGGTAKEVIQQPAWKYLRGFWAAEPLWAVLDY